MIITWDNAKRMANFDKHGLDFAELDVDFFLNSPVVPAERGRFKSIGRLGRDVVVVIFALLGAEAISVVSMRPASKKERSLLNVR